MKTGAFSNDRLGLLHQLKDAIFNLGKAEGTLRCNLAARHKCSSPSLHALAGAILILCSVYNISFNQHCLPTALKTLFPARP